LGLLIVKAERSICTFGREANFILSKGTDQKKRNDDRD